MILLGRGNFPPLLPLNSCGWITHKIDTRQISSRKKNCFSHFFILIFIGVQLLCNAVSVSAVQQSESALHIHISPLFWISFPFRSSQSTEQSSLCYRAGSQLSILHTVFYIYTSAPISQFSAPPFPALVTITLFSMSVSLFLLCMLVHR